MGWLRDRFSRTYAYHYHKKVAIKAVRSCPATPHGAASATTTPHNGLYEYERIVQVNEGKNKIEKRYKTQLNLRFVADTEGWSITGSGEEFREGESSAESSATAATTIGIQEGRVASSGHAFYWIEHRPRKERHLVVGTFSVDFWDKSVVRVDDGYCVKRLDIEKCGLPGDGDIRETLLSFSSRLPVEENTKANNEKSTDDKVLTAAEPVGSPDHQATVEEHPSNGTAASAVPANATEPKKILATNSESVSRAAPLDELPSIAKDTAALPPASFDESPTNATNRPHSVDNSVAPRGHVNDVVLESIPETAVDTILNDHTAFADDLEPTDQITTGDSKDRSNTVESLLPTIREARDLINEVLNKSKHKGDDNTSGRTSIQRVPSQDEMQSVKLPVPIDLSAFEEVDEDEMAVYTIQKHRQSKSPRDKLSTLNESSWHGSQNEDSESEQLAAEASSETDSHVFATSPVPEWREAVAGMGAAAFSRTVMAPVERVKLLVQLQSSTHPLTAIQATRQVFCGEGIRAFWRGNLSSVLRVGGTSAVNFTCLDYFKRLLKLGNASSADWWTSLVAGGLAGATSTTLFYPLEFVRTRLAVEPEFQSMRHVVRTIWAHDGLFGLYQGYGVALVGGVYYRLLYLGGYDAAKGEVLKMQSHDGATQLTWGQRLVVAQSISLGAGTLSYPMDTIRRRMMMQAGLSERLYRNGWHCFLTIFREQGVRGFYKGLGPNIVRSVGGALLLVAYDTVRPWLG